MGLWAQNLYLYNSGVKQKMPDEQTITKINELETKTADVDKKVAVIEANLKTQGEKVCSILKKLDEVREVAVQIVTDNTHQSKEIEELKEDVKEATKERAGIKVKQAAIYAAVSLLSGGAGAGVLKLLGV